MTPAEEGVTEGAIRRVAEAFGNSVVVERSGSQTSVAVGKNSLRDVLLFLKSDEELRFTVLTDLFVVDRGHVRPRFEIVYLLNSFESKKRITIKTRIDDGESVPTVSDLWGGAEWLEREAYDMFGLKFEGHPFLRRILTVEDFDGHPLRKDFPTEGFAFDTPVKVDLTEETT